MQERVITVAMYVIIALAYALSGYASNVLQDDDVEFDPMHFGETVVIGVVAGGIMAFQDTEDVEVAMGVAIPIADQIWNAIEHRGD